LVNASKNQTDRSKTIMMDRDTFFLQDTCANTIS
jgi:hypothetical protein